MKPIQHLFEGITVSALVCGALAHPGPVEAQSSAGGLMPPSMLERDALLGGNPLAPYEAMLELADDYQASGNMAAFYAEIRAHYEQFLGVPRAGIMAMSEIPNLHRNYAAAPEPVAPEYEARSALSVILERAGQTRIVVWGEEHHLPQTRSLFESMLTELWSLGYRYLAAEAFTDAVMERDYAGPTYDSGFYTMDPVFASAIRRALQLGYRLVAYDTSERGAPDDPSFRDRTQAENLQSRIFDADPDARVLVIAGRGHASEVVAPDGWTPMTSVLKEVTGIDPFTLYAPTMGQRRTPREEHPMYRYATDNGLVPHPTIFANPVSGETLGSESFDAYIFWPRVSVVYGRPDWLASTLGRQPVAIPEVFPGPGLRLVQAFLEGEPYMYVPVDQVLLRPGEPVPTLMLPPGRFELRVLDATGTLADPVKVTIR